MVEYSVVGDQLPDTAWPISGLTPDGRYATIGPHRVDLDSGDVVALPFPGLLTASGDAVISLVAGRVTRVDLATAAVTTYADLPADWNAAELTGVSGDSGRAGVWATNGVLADVGAFTLDAASDTWSRPDETLGVDGTSNSSRRQLFSTAGDVVVFAYQNGPTGCSNGCSQIWASTSTGLALVNPTPAGTAPATGWADLIDISPNGRFVLFRSNSTDIAAGPGHPNGSYFVRDIDQATTARLAIIPSTAAWGVGSISDDGQRVAFLTDQTVQFAGSTLTRPMAAVNDRGSDVTTVLAPEITVEWTIGGFPKIEISADGRRVVYTTSWSEHRHIVANLDQP